MRQESDDITPPPECVESVESVCMLSVESTEQKNVLKFMALKTVQRLSGGAVGSAAATALRCARRGVPGDLSNVTIRGGEAFRRAGRAAGLGHGSSKRWGLSSLA